MMSLLRFSSNKELRRVLKNTNIGNFIPSESKIRKEQSELASYLSEDHFEFGKMTFNLVVTMKLLIKKEPKLG